MRTPGPWEVARWRGTEWPDNRRSVSCNGSAIAISPRYIDPDDPELVANFHLLAAAPDLLEALGEALEAMAAADYDKWHSDSPVMTQARAAIAKAKGEQA